MDFDRKCTKGPEIEEILVFHSLGNAILLLLIGIENGTMHAQGFLKTNPAARPP